jgi:MFS family permease
VFGAGADFAYRALLLGFLLGTAPLVQFFASPIMGGYADRMGRKPVLVVSVLANGLAHFLFGFAILTGQLWLMFTSRVLAGLGSANLAVANSAVADISEPEAKVRNFGLIGVGIGLGFIVGAYLGGTLSDPSFAPGITAATPLWLATALTVLNAMFIMLFFSETLREPLRKPMSVLTGARNFARAFTIPNLRVLFIVSLLLGFGFNFFAQFFSVFLISKFSLTSADIGIMFVYVGVCIALTQGVATRVLSRIAAPVEVLRWAPLVGVVTLLALTQVERLSTVYFLLPIVALGYGVNPPNLSALISNLAGKESQGEALGISQSMAAVSFGIPPIISGIVSGIDVALPMTLAAVSIFAAWVVFRFGFRSDSARVFHEV